MRVHAEAAGSDTLAVTDVASSLAELAAVEGDLDAAIAHLDAAHESGTGRTGWTKPGWNAVFRAGLALEAGDLDDAELFTERAKPTTARTAMSVIGLDLHLACRRGDLDRARALLPELIAVADRDGFVSPSQVHDVVSAWLSAGLPVDEVRPLVERVGHYVGHRLDPDSPWRQLLGAQLAEAAGDVDEAIALYGSAATTLGAAPEILAGARGTVHVGAAANLARAGRLDEARAHAAEAARILARWRGWRVDQLRAVERRLGLGDEPAGPETLTPREREVVALLAEGLTNAQLAERLYISPRTAAVHVSNVLSKLGMALAHRGGRLGRPHRPGRRLNPAVGVYTFGGACDAAPHVWRRDPRRGAAQELRGRGGARRRRLRGADRHDPRAPRAERRRQDDRGPHPDDDPAP